MDKLAEVKEYPFEFSVIMAVYNVALFLREAVDSLIEQDFGFEHIQLIMVDDGSTDGSGAICDEYAEQYPENILVVHKENGGVASARNAGLPYVKGKYINFLDSDDRLALGTMRKVANFFDLHNEETDVVALPLFYFDGASGQHKLNYKFRKKTRVIDIYKEWSMIQLSLASAFVKHDIWGNMKFDERLAFAEDTQLLIKILLNKGTLGVIHNSRYHYRRRTAGNSSAIQKSEQLTEWYLPYLEFFQEQTIRYCMDKLSYLPKFVQFTLAYDLQWRVVQEQIPNDLFSDEDKELYCNKLFSLFKYIDDDVIMAQQSIYPEHKLFMLQKKYGQLPNLIRRHNDVVLAFQNTIVFYLSKCQLSLEFLKIDKDSCCIEGYTVMFPSLYSYLQVEVEINEQVYDCQVWERKESKCAVEEPILEYYGFKVEIPLLREDERYNIKFFVVLDGVRIENKNIKYRQFFPVGNEYRNAYYLKNGWRFSTCGNRLIISSCGRKGHWRSEKAFLLELWKKKQAATRKAFWARLAYYFFQMFFRKPIWLISDRPAQADDNGEAFFKYLIENHKGEKKFYFALNPDSPDYNRLKKIGKVIPFLGWRYKILYLLAENIVSSQGEHYIFRPFQKFSGPYRDLSQKQKFIFLQHGITKDDLSDWLNRYNKNISMIVTATKPEYQSFLDYDYFYDENVVKLTGFPRYDRLYHSEKKQIVIMPTWRAYLVTGINPVTGIRNCKAGFADSQYCQMYSSLLSDVRLLHAAKTHGYTVAFVNHPNMLCSEDFMSFSEEVKIIPSNYAYRDIFAESDLLVTDYSSVAFDFAYLRKPVLYYQADVDEFFSGIHTYEKGYFDYERDGFGEVEYDTEKLVDRIIEYMQNNCQLKEKYRQRIDATFPFNDQNNCERVYNAILALDKQEN